MNCIPKEVEHISNVNVYISNSKNLMHPHVLNYSLLTDMVQSEMTPTQTFVFHPNVCEPSYDFSVGDDAFMESNFSLYVVNLANKQVIAFLSICTSHTTNWYINYICSCAKQASRLLRVLISVARAYSCHFQQDIIINTYALQSSYELFTTKFNFYPPKTAPQTKQQQTSGELEYRVACVSGGCSRGMKSRRRRHCKLIKTKQWAKIHNQCKTNKRHRVKQL